MIINGLEKIDYQDLVCLNLYNEFTTDKEFLLQSIDKIREKIPSATILFATNRRVLAIAEVSIMYVTLHGKRDALYSDLYSLNRFAELS